MAEITGGFLKDVEGHLDGITIYKWGGKTFMRPTHIKQPRRLSRKQLALREQIAHNNILWRRLKATQHTYFEGGVDSYRCFMSVNTLSPTVYLTKQQLANNMSFLLPKMAVSNGPLSPIRYQFSEVDGQPALLTDLIPQDMEEGKFLLYVLRQKIIHWQEEEDLAQVNISVVPLTFGPDIEIPHIGIVHLSTSIPFKPFQKQSGNLSLIGNLFSDSMLGFALVRIHDGHVSSQRVITRCTYYEKYTTEEALQVAAKSYKGLTGE